MKGLLILVAVVAVLAGGFFYAKQQARPQPTATIESETEREESIRSAFAPTVGSEAAEASTDPKLEAEAKAFLRKLGKGFRDANPTALNKLISADAMMSYVINSGLVDLTQIKRGDLRDFKAGFKSGLAKGFSNNAATNAFEDDFTIARIETIRDGEMIVYMRGRSTAFDVNTKIRWWLLRNEKGDWQVYDYEDLDQGVRVSALMGSIMGGAMTGVPPEWIDPLTELIGSMRELGTDPVAAFETMAISSKKLIDLNPPTAIESLGRLMYASTLLSEAKFEQALQQVDRCDELSGGAPIVHYQRGNCLAGLERYEEALTSYARYAEILGKDSDLYEMIADCYYKMGDSMKGLEAAEKGLADEPNALGCLASYALCLPEERRGELATHIAKLDDKESGYETILDYALQQEVFEVYDFVLPMLKRDFPESGLIEYYEGEPETTPASPEGGATRPPHQPAN